MEGVLVLARNCGEVVMIGDDISVIVTEILPTKVKIGFKAPKHLPIHRLEIYREIRRENQSRVKDETKEPSPGSDSRPPTADSIIADVRARCLRDNQTFVAGDHRLADQTVGMLAEELAGMRRKS